MSKIQEDEIVGAFVSGECVSFDLLTEEEKNSLTEDCLITQSDLQGECWYFCDRSKQRIQ